MLKVVALQHPLSIDCFRDGGGYAVQVPPLTQTNLFMKVGWVDELYIKVPSGTRAGRLPEIRQAGTERARGHPAVEEAERFERLAE